MISTLKGDITRLNFDLIVNDAKENLMPHPGINSKIFKQAGPNLLQECISLKGCAQGNVILSHGYDIPCKGIIHAVTPYYIDGQHQEMEVLKACYWNAMALAYKIYRNSHISPMTIAFPPLGMHSGYPREEACQIAVQTIQSLFYQYPEAKDIQVVFVCENQKDYTLYKEVIHSEVNGRYIA